jgi:putative heme-binding domain-containing protein
VTENARALASLLTTIAAPHNGDLNRRSRHEAALPSDRHDAARSRPQFATLALLLDWLQRNNKSLTHLQNSGGEPMQRALTAADQIFASARVLAVDTKTPADERVSAIAVLGRGRVQQSEDFELLAGLLTPTSPVEVQLAALTSLGRMNRAAVPERLLAGWSGYGAAVRSSVLTLVMSRPAWAQVLLDRIEADHTMLPQIDAGRRAALTQHSNVKLAERAAAIFNAGMDGNRQAVMDRYLAATPALHADSKKGETVFANTCSACHKFGDVPGRLVGPDLATVKDRSAPYLLTHILDPNRAVEDRYVFYTVTTHDGRVLAGMIAGEAGNSVTLIGLDGIEQTISRTEIRSLVSSGRSLMPDGLEAAIPEEDMANLIAFLAGAGGAEKK